MERKNRSIVWQHFTKLSQTTAKCSLCSSITKCNNNTSNLKEHLKRKHPASLRSADCIVDSDYINSLLVDDSTHSNSQRGEFIHFLEGSGTPPQKSRQVTLKYSLSPLPERKKCKMDTLVAKMICKDLQNISIVEDEGFQELLKELEPRYNLPSRRTIMRHLIPNLYETEKEKIKDMLNDTLCVSITTDIWSAINMHSFITVTAHYYYNNEVASNVLNTIRLEDNHTANNIAEVLKNIFENWKIENKIFAIVTDGGKNIKSACKTYLHLTHLPCNAHLINLVIKNSIQNTQGLELILDKCRRIVEHFKSSSVAINKLNCMQQQIGHPVLKLKQDVQTSCNSTLIMIERLIKVKEPLSATLNGLPGSPEPLNADQWNILDDCVSVLKPMELISTELSSEKYVSLSKVIPLVKGVQTVLKNSVVLSTVGAQLKINVIEQFNNRFGACEKCKLKSLSTLLDPRFKTAAFGVESNAKIAQDYLLYDIEEKFKEEIVNSSKSKSSPSTTISESNNLWNFLDNRVAGMTKYSTPTSSAATEIQQYFSLPYESREKCPIKFWSQQKLVMPKVGEFALKYLCVPATSVPSERLFSKTGQLILERRSRLHPKYVDKILFLNNLK